MRKSRSIVLFCVTIVVILATVFIAGIGIGPDHLGSARNITLGELVSRYADPLSEKAFEKEDFQMYLLNIHLEKTINPMDTD